MYSEHTNIIIPKYNLNYTISRDKNIIEASLEKNIKLAYSCKSGICGTCKAKVLNGEFKRNNKINHILTEDEKENNIVLLCQAAAKSDVIKIEPLAPIPRRVELSKAREIISEILSIKNINKNIIELCISVPKRFIYNYKKSNYIEIVIPSIKNNKKYYILDSINQNEKNNGTINLLINKNANRNINKFFNHSLIHGETLTIKGPYETDLIDISNDKPLLFLSENDHIISTLNEIKNIIYSKDNISIMLISSFESIEDIILLEEMHKLQFSYKNFSYKISIIDSKGTNKLSRFQVGKTVNLINKVFPDLSNHLIFINGKLDFINENYEKVVNLGAKQENIHNKN